MLAYVADSTQIQFERRLEPIDGVLPPAFEASLYRIVQEGINNVLKHAGATRVEVEVGQRADCLRLMIHDNGRGFDPTAAAAQAAKGRGLGLSRLAERARMMGGHLAVQSCPGEGTTLVLTVPLPCRARAPGV
jgi:signal transduction histidine kinase